MKERTARIAKWAASVVVTVGATACGAAPITRGNPPPPPPPPEGEIVLRDDGTCWRLFADDCSPDALHSIPASACNPPPSEPVDCPDALLAAPQTNKVVTVSADGRCWQTGEIPDFACPPPEEGFTCNPPPPTRTRVKCPPDKVLHPASANVPVDVRADGSCWQLQPVANFQCPPPESGFTCNPPPPTATQVLCPPKEPPPPVLRDAANGANVQKLADGTCWEVEPAPAIDCPAGMRCNPPAPKRTQVNCSSAPQ